ncbi:hypothetical protein DFH08DRAFT_823665 [Mycena albidolilacea]|uniref:Secreted protein n=1 Tax=Mycena albidolilacea TaxID=1033008 RepID=A0AAD7EBG6_9AGAR|nr:hypothetical protein DFH08DRAFT_823665 [Mycena albidolilacea]
MNKLLTFVVLAYLLVLASAGEIGGQLGDKRGFISTDQHGQFDDKRGFITVDQHVSMDDKRGFITVDQHGSLDDSPVRLSFQQMFAINKGSGGGEVLITEDRAPTTSLELQIFIGKAESTSSRLSWQCGKQFKREDERYANNAARKTSILRNKRAHTGQFRTPDAATKPRGMKQIAKENVRYDHIDNVRPRRNGSVRAEKEIITNESYHDTETSG